MKEEFKYFNEEYNNTITSYLEFATKYVIVKDKDGNDRPLELREKDIQFLKQLDANKRTK